MNGEPRAASQQQPTPPQPSAASADALRSRNRRRDDAIRKKVEQELSRRTQKRHSTGPNHSHAAATASRSEARRIRAGSVASLRPATAIIIIESARIIQAAQLMAAKRTDAVLVVGEDGALAGILTDKDIAYRVVAEGLDARTTLVSAVMTRDPIAVFDRGPRNEALNIMISRRFRHLPVVSDASSDPDNLEDADPNIDDPDDPAANNASGATKVVGLLDITKCVFDRLEDLERKVNEDRSIISAMDVLERRGAVASEHAGVVRLQHGVPDVGFVLAQTATEHAGHGEVPEVSLRASVRDAARAMKAIHSTAVLVSATASAPSGSTVAASGVPGITGGASSASLTLNEDDKIGGIFTTKDIVLRVIAASLDPNTTSVVRVMTPHPDSVPAETTILDALKKLRAGHYLHLPVVDAGTPIGLVDVMTLTVSMLTYLMNNYNSAASSSATPMEDGPVWNKFWNSTFANLPAEAESDHLSQTSDSRMASSIHSTQRHAMSNSRQSLPGQDTMTPTAASAAEERTPSVLSRPFGTGVLPGTPAPSTVPASVIDDPSMFAFKLRDMTRSTNNKIFRFSSRADSLYDLYKHVAIKTSTRSVFVDAVHAGTLPSASALSPLAASPLTPTNLLDFETLTGETARLCYMDDEGDVVYIESDHDLEEAVSLSRRIGWSRLLIFLGDPASVVNAVSETVASHVSSGAASPVLRMSQRQVRERSASMLSQPHSVVSSEMYRAATPDQIDASSLHQHASVVPNDARAQHMPKSQQDRAQDTLRNVMDFLKEAPMPVNVAISAGIVVVASYILMKLRS